MTAVLVDANSIFMSDLLGMGIHLQHTYRQNYNIDPRNSTFTHLHGTPDEVDLDVSAHFAVLDLDRPELRHGVEERGKEIAGERFAERSSERSVSLQSARRLQRYRHDLPANA